MPPKKFHIGSPGGGWRRAALSLMPLPANAAALSAKDAQITARTLGFLDPARRRNRASM